MNGVFQKKLDKLKKKDFHFIIYGDALFFKHFKQISETVHNQMPSTFPGKDMLINPIGLMQGATSIIWAMGSF